MKSKRYILIEMTGESDKEQAEIKAIGINLFEMIGLLTYFRDRAEIDHMKLNKE